MRTFTFDESDAKRATGIETFDGRAHSADTTIIACGSWTAEALPEAHRTVEATAGTVMFIDVPPERHDLRAKFHPDNFPIRRYVSGSGDREFEGSMFPITKDGRLKFGFRAKNVSGKDRLGLLSIVADSFISSQTSKTTQRSPVFASPSPGPSIAKIRSILFLSMVCS